MFVIVMVCLVDWWNMPIKVRMTCLYKGNGWDKMSTHKRKFASGEPILN